MIFVETTYMGVSWFIRSQIICDFCRDDLHGRLMV